MWVWLIDLRGGDWAEFEVEDWGVGGEGGDEGGVAEVVTAAGDDDEVTGLELGDGGSIGEGDEDQIRSAGAFGVVGR